MQCKFCFIEKSSPRSVRSHETLCKENPLRRLSPFSNPENHKNKSNGFLKGTQTKMSDLQREKLGEKSRDYWSKPKNREAQSALMKQVMQTTLANHPSSYSSTNVCGRAKKSIVNGIIFHSSWEVLVADWLDKNSIQWVRNIDPIKYTWNGPRLYFPDFYLPELNLYLEVKGYETERDLAKWKVLNNLIVFKRVEIDLIKADNLSSCILRGREHRS